MYPFYIPCLSMVDSAKNQFLINLKLCLLHSLQIVSITTDRNKPNVPCKQLSLSKKKQLKL